VALALIDAVTHWYPLDPTRTYRMQPVDAAEGFAAAEAFGCSHVSVVPAFPADFGLDGFVEHFAALCDQAAERGLAAALEFTAVRPVYGLATGWEHRAAADRPNGGLIFDTWQFFRSEPDFALLAAIPGERIFAVQVSDGAAEPMESLLKDMMLHRRLPGDGVFDLRRALNVLQRTGGLNRVGPEVASRAETGPACRRDRRAGRRGAGRRAGGARRGTLKPV